MLHHYYPDMMIMIMIMMMIFSNPLSSDSELLAWGDSVVPKFFAVNRVTVDWCVIVHEIVS